MSVSLSNGSVYKVTSSKEFRVHVTVGKVAHEGGVYNCSATNMFGEDQATLSLNGLRLFFTN